MVQFLQFVPVASEVAVAGGRTGSWSKEIIMPENSNFPQSGLGGSGTSPRFGQEVHGGGVCERGTETASSVLGKASEMVSSAGETAREAMSSAVRKAEDMASAVGNRVTGAASTVADTLESGREYVTQRGVTGMGEDLTNFVRRNPLPSVLFSFCLGFFIARTLKD